MDIKKLIFGLLLLTHLYSCNNLSNKEPVKGRISISSTDELYPLTIKWSKEYRKKYNLVTFNILPAGSSYGISDIITKKCDIYFSSKDISLQDKEKGLSSIVVAHDLFLPTMNNKHPLANLIRKKGMTRQNFIDIWITGKITTWKNIYPEMNLQNTTPLGVYTRIDDTGANETWAKYLGYPKEKLLGSGITSEINMAEAIRRDLNGIGYNNINYIYDKDTKQLISGIQIIPIDLNENNQIDDHEDFYINKDKVVKAASSGNYPLSLIRNLYFVIWENSSNMAVKHFVEWVIKEGDDII